MKGIFYNLSNPQNSILLTEQYYENTNVNSLCGTAIIKEILNFEALEKALNELVEKNDNFLLKFVNKENTIIQSVEEYKPFKVDLVMLNDKNEVSKLENEMIAEKLDFKTKTFNFKMFKFPDGTGGYTVNVHHIIADGWSLGLLCRKVMINYSNIIGKKIDEDTSSSYIDYLQSEQNYLNSNKFENDRKYWNEIFATIPETVSIPGSRSNLNSLSCKAHRKSFTIPKDLVKNIQDYCTQNNDSLFNFFMTILAIYMYKISSINDFVIGTPILNRTNFKEKNTTGMFINATALRVNIDSDETFLELMHEISISSRNLLKHQKYPYMNLLEDLRKIDPSIPNLYNVVLSYQLTKANNVTDFDYKTRWAFNGTASDDLEIQLYDLDDTGDLSLAYDYKTSKYTGKDIEELNSRLFFIIDEVLNNKNTLKIKNIKILPQDEENKILYDFNQTSLDYPNDKSIPELFEEQVKLNPSKVAAVFEDSSLTFDELNKRANNLAKYLIKNNVQQGDIVGILLNRSIEILICMMGILKAGCTYALIDPEYPEARVKYIIENSSAKMILSENKLFHKFNVDCPIVDAKLNNKEIYNNKNISNPQIKVAPEDLAYIIYTSGSTGTPKGVTITHKNVVNFIYGTKEQLGLQQNTVIGSISTVCFDIFVLESLLPLCLGLKTVIANNHEQTIPQDLNKMCIKNNVKLIQATPSRIAFLTSDENSLKYLENLKYILMGGESASPSLLKKLRTLTQAKLFNMYGPSETTVCASGKDLTESDNITIGKPFPNSQIYILNKELNLIPPNAIGEIYISGDNVGNGYFKRNDLTSKSFVKNPFDKTKVMYKTGDLGSWSNNGEIYFKGRNDNQIKLRGLRIELEEIEHKINMFHPRSSISSVIILRKVNNRDTLHAFICSDEQIDLQELKNYLLENLPNYMVPNTFSILKEFPMTPNGKIDKKSLQNMEVTIDTEYEAPSTEEEIKLEAIFKKVLNIDKISINDNFFELGGDSLTAIKLQIEAFNEGISFSYKNIFKYPTIKKLAKSTLETDTEVEKDDYDYSKINDLLKNTYNSKIEKQIKYNNILLAGATGFLGSHILQSLIETTKSNIYCLIRASKNAEPKERLLESIHFYFGNKYDELIDKRIFILKGDISKNNLGLGQQANNICFDCVINSAAIVKHYGKESIFHETNINGIQNLINFCLKYNCKFTHISTLSVSGNMFEDSKVLIADVKKNTVFSEKEFFINQDLSNIYIYTKFLAERLILENIISNNLDAKIIRVGNLTNRYSDGKFQVNAQENAFLNKIKSFLEIGMIPDYLAENYLEFTPVDLCAEAVVKLTHIKTNQIIFHLFNNNHLPITDFIDILNQLAIDIKITDKARFNKKIKEILNGPTNSSLAGIINDFDKNKNLTYETNITFKNNVTNSILKELSFKWPNINKEYLKKYISYLRKIGYLKY